MKRRQLWWIAGAVLALALLLAFPLRDFLERTVVVPVAYFFWTLGLFYRAMPQLLWWVLVVILALLFVVSSLAPSEEFVARRGSAPVKPQGQVEGLAQSIRKTRDGDYFKWLVARRLGKLAYSMLIQREGDKGRSVFAPLEGVDWRPSPRIRAYLETGLHGSFADASPTERGRLSVSPLDLDIEEAITFLESQLETRRDRYR